MTQTDTSDTTTQRAAASHYAALTSSLRDATKWLLAAAAAVGAVLVGGLQLTGLGGLTADQWPRLLLACVGLAIGLLGVGAVLWWTSALLVDDWVTVSSLVVGSFHGGVTRTRDRRQDEGRHLWVELDLAAEELCGPVASDVPDLFRRLQAANAEQRDAAPGTGARRGGPGQAELAAAATCVVEFANFTVTLWRFRRLRRRLAGCAAAVAVGAALYAWAASPPSAQTEPRASAGAYSASAAGDLGSSDSLATSAP